MAPAGEEYISIHFKRHFLKCLFLFCSQTTENAAPSLRSANLSALKKRWEQAGNPDQAKPSVVPQNQHTSRSRPVLSKAASTDGRNPPLKSPVLLTDQGGQLTSNSIQEHSAAPKVSQSEEQRGMDRGVLMQRERPEKLEEQVPTSPFASYAKPSVPLNNLKMKFERGEDTKNKVFIDKFTGEEHKNTFGSQSI